ncbi:hypothetical protein N657DRAFT_428649 [Parathielavia appendiculata]|uniref:Uncharacterized protein n=1 Tax=Parathielavia appendiculata TaxID=2587402 RepID=A0AAN6TZU8_9PEZI|nr:hypothetical protein N657DRAFT_428649 [Parathielavia appendiculata]
MNPYPSTTRTRDCKPSIQVFTSSASLALLALCLSVAGFVSTFVPLSLDLRLRVQLELSKAEPGF